jgi:hypothetical protein
LTGLSVNERSGGGQRCLHPGGRGKHARLLCELPDELHGVTDPDPAPLVCSNSRR